MAEEGGRSAGAGAGHNRECRKRRRSGVANASYRLVSPRIASHRLFGLRDGSRSRQRVGTRLGAFPERLHAGRGPAMRSPLKTPNFGAGRSVATPKPASCLRPAAPQGAPCGCRPPGRTPGRKAVPDNEVRHQRQGLEAAGTRRASRGAGRHRARLRGAEVRNRDRAGLASAPRAHQGARQAVLLALIVPRVMRRRLRLANSTLSPQAALDELRRIQRRQHHRISIDAATPITGAVDHRPGAALRPGGAEPP